MGSRLRPWVLSHLLTLSGLLNFVVVGLACTWISSRLNFEKILGFIATLFMPVCYKSDPVAVVHTAERVCGGHGGLHQHHA